VPGREIRAFSAGEISRSHGGLESDEASYLPEPDVQRGVVAVAQEWFGISADEGCVKVGEQLG